jgi:hypothetical protein
MGGFVIGTAYGLTATPANTLIAKANQLTTLMGCWESRWV